jgi:hypothetical protein
VIEARIVGGIHENTQSRVEQDDPLTKRRNGRQPFEETNHPLCFAPTGFISMHV